MFPNPSKVVLCDRHTSFAMLSKDDLHVSWQVQRFGHVHVHSVCQAQHFRRAVLPDCEMLRITMSGLRQLVQACTLFGRSGNSDCLFASQMQHLVKIRCVWGTVVFAVAGFRIGTAVRGAMLLSSFMSPWQVRYLMQLAVDLTLTTFHTFNSCIEHFMFRSTFCDTHFTLHTPHA